MKFVIALIALMAPFSISASDGQSKERISRLLFVDAASQLSEQDRRDIYHGLGVGLSVKSGTLVDELDNEISFTVELVDLNQDGVREVFVIGGNTLTSGRAGSSVWLFIKARNGRYVANLGFPASDYEILDAKSGAFPELKFGGPGFCNGVWGWNGNKYVFVRNEASIPGGCDAVEKMHKSQSPRTEESYLSIAVSMR